MEPLAASDLPLFLPSSAFPSLPLHPSPLSCRVLVSFPAPSRPPSSPSPLTPHSSSLPSLLSCFCSLSPSHPSSLHGCILRNPFSLSIFSFSPWGREEEEEEEERLYLHLGTRERVGRGGRANEQLEFISYPGFAVGRVYFTHSMHETNNQ